MDGTTSNLASRQSAKSIISSRFLEESTQRGNDRAETHRSGKSGVGERRGDLRLLITSNLIERRSDFFCFFDPLRLVVFSVRTPALSAL